MQFNIQKIDSFTGHRDCVYELSSGNTENTFFSASGDGMIVEWNTLTPDLGKPLAKVNNSVYAMHFIENEKKMWLAQNFEGLHLIDSDEKKEIGSIQLGKMAFFTIKSFENLLFVGDSIGQIHVIDKNLLAFKKHIKAANVSVRSIAINTKTGELAAGYSDNLIRIFDLYDYSLKYQLEGHKNSVFTLQYLPDSDFLISGSRDAHLMSWEVNQKYQQILDVPAHLYAINHAIYLEGLNIIATASMDKSIKLWDAASLKLLKVIDKARHAGHGTSINKLLWLPKSKILLSASDDRTISMWKLF
jgi:WD40 repeat protein